MLIAPYKTDGIAKVKEITKKVPGCPAAGRGRTWPGARGQHTIAATPV